MTSPPEVVRIRASSTVLVKASSFVNLDFAGILADCYRMYPTQTRSRQAVRCDTPGNVFPP